MKNKDLLIIFNIFGTQRDEDAQIAVYFKTIDQLFKHVEEYGSEKIRVVVAANLVSDYCVEELKNRYKNNITIFKIDERFTCQIVTNKVVLESIKLFNEEYEGYFYLSSSLFFPEKEQIFENLISKLKTKKYGIIQLQVNNDHGYHFLGFGPTGWISELDFDKDYFIPLGNHANFHAAIIHKSLKDFYGIPVTDVHGKCGMESVLSYCCSALRKHYILHGGLCLSHDRASDTNSAVNKGRHKFIPCRAQMFNRDKYAIARDPAAQSCGIGYYPGMLANNEPDWNGVILKHKKDKFDDKFLSLDDNMKFVAKKYFFSNKKELDYNSIEFTLR